MEASSGLSKAARKNLKRKAAKQRAAFAAGATSKPKRDVVTPEELKEALDREMELAKEKNDQEKMRSLREQIWVINDMIAGVKTDLPDAELKKILDKLPISNALKSSKPKPQPEPAKAKENEPPNTNQPQETEAPKENGVSKPESENGLGSMSIEEAEKKLRNLKKKLREARRINAKIANGEKVEKNQREKAKLEKSLADEVEDLELDINTEKLNR